jgi:hypothetical protein
MAIISTVFFMINTFFRLLTIEKLSFKLTESRKSPARDDPSRGAA